MNAPNVSKYLAGLVILALSITPLVGLNASAVPNYSYADLGNFSLYYDPFSGNVHNLTFASPNGSILLANDILSSGKNTSVASHGHMDLSKTLTLQSSTLFVTNDSDMLYFASTSKSGGSLVYMNFSLPSAVTVMSFPASQSSLHTYNSNSLLTGFMVNPVYRMTVTGGYIYYMSNAFSNISSDGRTIVFGNVTLNQGMPLLVAVTPSASLKYSIDSQINNGSISSDPISYDSASGSVTGKYISFSFDSSTGTISEYKNLYSNTVVFSNIHSFGDGYIGIDSVSPLFPTSEPIAAGSVFFYANSTSVYKIHNTVATPGSFYTSNGTTIFQLWPGLNASVFHPSQMGNQVKERFGSNYSDYLNLGIGRAFEISFSPTIVSISNSAFSAELIVHNGNVTVTGNIIEVSTSKIAFSQFVVQNEFLNTSLHVRNQLQYALQNGKMGAVISLWRNGTTGYNTTNYYNSSLQLMIQNALSNRVQIQLKSQYQSGTNIAIFIPNSIIQNTSQFRALLNNQSMVKLQNMDRLINSTEQSQGQYYLTQVDGGTLVLLHIPHFSEQNLEITGAEKNPLDWTPVIYSAIIISVVVVAGIYSYIMLKKRSFQ